MEEAQKPCLSVVVAGHINSGKSTLLGHVYYLLGNIPEREVSYLRSQAQLMGKPSLFYSWIFDRETSEKQRGITFSGHQKKLEGPNSEITIWDTPGHRGFIKNMLTCIVQSDMMVLCVSAYEDEFNTSICPQFGSVKTILISSLSLGIKQVIVVVNKMDTVKYCEKRFVAVEQQLSNMMKKIGWKSENFSFIPVSSWHGDNLTVASVNMPWWKGQTFTQSLFSLPIPERLNHLPLRFVVGDSFRIRGIGTVVTGRISSGTLKPLQVITFGASIPNPITAFEIERHHHKLSNALSGMSVGVNFRALSYHIFKRGMVAGDASNYPPRYCSSFSAEVYIVNHPGSLSVGYTPIIVCGTAQIACKMSSIICLLSKTKEILEETPKSIKKGNFARVIFEPTKPMIVEEYSKFPDVLGRILIRDGPLVVGVGKVVGFDSKEEENKPIGFQTKAAVRID